MSKRKRAEDFEGDTSREEEGKHEKMEEEDSKDEKMEEEDSKDQMMPINPPISRNQTYEEVIQEIRKCQESLNVARHKLEQLDDQEDYLCRRTISCIDEANYQIDEALISLEESTKHWVSFLAIPEVPMRHILKYLDFKDKANFRLSSQSHRQVVDCFDVDFKSILIDMRNELEVYKILETEKKLKLKFDYRLRKMDQKLPNEFSGRIIELRGPPLKILDGVPVPNKIEKIHFEGRISHRDTLVRFNNFASSLRVLTIENIDLSQIKNQRFSLPNLENLQLFEVTSFEGIVQLLASCSTSLEHLALSYLFNDEHFSFESLSKIKLMRLKKMEVSYCDFTGIVNLLKLTSSSLKALLLVDHRGTKDDSFPAQPDICFPKLEWLYIYNCRPDLLSLLNCPAPRLNKLILGGDLPSILPTQMIHINPLPATARIEIDFNSVVVNKVLAAVAASVEELIIKGFLIELDGLSDLVVLFPKLKRLRVRSCKPELTKFLLGRSSCLQELHLQSTGTFSADFGPLDLRGVEKLTLSKNYSQDFNDLNLMVTKTANSLKELTVDQMSLPVLEVKQMKLTKLVLVEVPSGPGLCGLLNACQSTLEELQILDSFTGDEALSLEGLQEMKVLKKIKLDVWDHYLNQNAIRSGGLNQLLNQCSKSLKKLVLIIRDEDEGEKFSVSESNDFELLMRYLSTLDLNLPNLKILHLHPKPEERVVKQILLQLPRNVTLWFFTPHRESLEWCRFTKPYERLKHQC